MLIPEALFSELLPFHLAIPTCSMLSSGKGIENCVIAVEQLNVESTAEYLSH